MNERYLSTHYEKFVGLESDISREELEDLKTLIGFEEGEMVTDPKLILEKLYIQSGLNKYEKYELEKIPEDFELITIAKNAVFEYAKRYGKKDFVNITDDHIHIFKEGGVKDFTKGRLSCGSQASLFGEVIIERRSNIDTAITAFHELWHRLGSYSALQITKEGEFKSYRSGLGVYDRTDAKEERLRVVDEAVTGYVTKMFFDDCIQTSERFAEELEGLEENNEQVDTTRREEVKNFLEFVELLFLKNEADFASREEIIDMFITAQVTGNLLPLARLIEKTFGKGALRKLGNYK
jgi:hypothetical protein